MAGWFISIYWPTSSTKSARIGRYPLRMDRAQGTITLRVGPDVRLDSLLTKVQPAYPTCPVWTPGAASFTHRRKLMKKVDRRSALAIGLAAASTAMVKPAAAQTTDPLAGKDTTPYPGVVSRA